MNIGDLHAFCSRKRRKTLTGETGDQRASARWSWGVLMFLLFLSAHGQDTPSARDSLTAVWKDPSRPDSVRYSACFDLIQGVLLYSAPDSGLHYAQELERFCHRTKMLRAEASAIGLVGSCKLELGDRTGARAAFTRSHGLSVAHQYADIAAAALGNLGVLCFSQGQNDSAITFFEQAYTTLKEQGSREQAARALNNIAVLYDQVGRKSDAARTYDEAIREFEALDMPDEVATTESNLGVLYSQLGDYAHAEEIYLRAEGRLLKTGATGMLASVWGHHGALWFKQDSIARAKGYWERVVSALASGTKGRDLIMAYSNLGQAFLKLSELDSALAYQKRALVMAQEVNDQPLIGLANAGLACVALAQKDYKEAIRTGELALAATMGVENITNLEDIHATLYEAYAANNDMGRAYQHARSLLLLRDSTKTTEEQRTLLRLEYQHENDNRALTDSLSFVAEKTIQIKEIQKQKLVRNGFMGGFALVALFAGIFFTQRNRISKEKARSEELLLNILPAEVAEELKAKGSAEAVQLDQVTVLFSDFKGFTSLSEKLTPRELVRDLNECFSAFDHIMTKYGIEKIKTIGDAYMAAGGLPVPNATHAVDVINAGLEMRDFIAEGKARKVAAGLPFFEIRIGIHTGPVVAGIVGVKKFQYDIWGDTVNTASRMESSGEVGQVNISEATYVMVKDVEVGSQLPVPSSQNSSLTPGRSAGQADNQQPTTRKAFTFTPRGKVQAKGKGEMEMFFVRSSTEGAEA